MIIRSIYSGVIISNAIEINDFSKGDIILPNGEKKSYSMERCSSERLFTESELKARLNIFIEEHNKSKDSPLQKVSGELADQHDQNELLRGEINQWRLKCNGLEDENKQLQARIAELEAERQPVEVSAELAEAIKFYKNTEWPGKWPTPEGDWMGHFLLLSDYYTDKIPSKLKDALGLTSLKSRKEIIERGYVVKSDPVRSRIEQILKEHEGDESFEPVISAIIELFAEEEYLSPDETWELYHESRAHIPHVSMNEIIENIKEQNGDPDVIDQIITKQAD